MELKGTDAVMREINEITAKMGNVSVSVGFLGNADYPDGTPVAAVAYWNEFGVPSHGQPPRPYFRQMIAKESPTWPLKLGKLAKATNYDGNRVMSLMGQDIKGALQESINNLTSPPLSPSTIKSKGFGKPLIDTGNMIRAVDFEVKS